MPRTHVTLARTQGDEAQTRRDDGTRRALETTLPEWARGSVLVGPIAFPASTAVRVMHRLGQAHRGFIVARLVSATDGTAIVEIPTSDASYRASVADTHLQLRANHAATGYLVVF